MPGTDQKTIPVIRSPGPGPRRLRLLLVLQVLGGASAAWAQEDALPGGAEPVLAGGVLKGAAAPSTLLTGPIARIDIQGNTRTRASVILQAMRLSPGDVFTAEDEAELKQRLLNLKLFKRVEVTTRPAAGGVSLHVDVEERWTLLPVPAFTSGQGQWQAGVFAVESNLFGLNKMLVAGALGGNRGGTLFSMYRDSSIGGSRWTGSASLLVSRTERQRRGGNTVVDAYIDRRFDVAGALGYQVTPELNVGAGWFSLVNKPLTAQGYAAAPPRGDAHGVSLSAEYLGQDFHFFFNEGLVARALYRQGLDFLGSSRELRQVSLFASYTLPVAESHALTMTATHGQVWGDAFLDAQLLGGRTGSRGFAPAALWGETASSVTLEYQVPLWRPLLATLTAHAFVDVGRVAWTNSVLRYVSPGMGLRVYVREVAIPAVGFEVTRNPQSGELIPAAAVGFGF